MRCRVSTTPVVMSYGIGEPLSLAEPQEVDLKQSATLKTYLEDRGLYESQKEAALREEVGYAFVSVASLGPGSSCATCFPAHFHR